ncbi:hypothetical protein [Silvibacterium acidisoli]|uniref:hypothetical protein n=1 Tax=Acidobacteriaceae bacterium ZG23-2 TaxID=2883246 RepID=UPI00406D0092
MRRSFSLAVPILLLILLPVSLAQTPPDYRGVSIRAHGVFVTPVPDAPFSATVEIVSKQMVDGSLTVIRTSTAHIARDAAGRIYNEMRAQVPPSFQGEPPLISAHIYDPNTRLSTFLNPQTKLARQILLARPMPQKSPEPDNEPKPGARLEKVENTGEQTLDGLHLEGVRKTWTVPAAASGTGTSVEIADLYWYSSDLTMYVLIQHDDPRTGEQIVALKDIRRTEPDASLFTIPANYRVVDETPQR